MVKNKKKIKSKKMKKNPLLYFENKFKYDEYWKNLSKNLLKNFLLI